MERHAVTRAASRSAAILLVAAAIASPCAILEKSSLAVPLAIGMNVSEPLIALNDFVQGRATDSARYRRDAAPEIGKEHVTRDGILLVAVTALTVLVEGWWRTRVKRARRRARSGRE